MKIICTVIYFISCWALDKLIGWNSLGCHIIEWESVICNILHSDCKKILKMSNYFFSLFSEFHDTFTWENLIKIMRVGGNTSNWEGWDLWVSLPTIMAKVKIQENSQIKLFCKILTNNAGLEERLKIPACSLGKLLWYFACPGPLLTCLSLWFFRGWFACTLVHWASKLEKLLVQQENLLILPVMGLF